MRIVLRVLKWAALVILAAAANTSRTECHTGSSEAFEAGVSVPIGGDKR
jgi:hypothetical protein